MSVRILQGDVRAMLATLEPESIQAVVTSPPYFRLRSYLPDGHEDKAREIGMEATPAEFVATLVEVFEAVKRVMRPDSVLFVNLGDSYAGSGKGPTGHNGIGDQATRQGFVNVKSAGVKAKSLYLIPQRFAIAMQDAGWIVRQEIVWAKRAPMPESVRDRCTSAWEPIYMFTKQGSYFWDQEAVRTPVKAEWTVRAPSGWDTGEGGHGAFHRNGRETSVPTGEVRDGGANLRNVWDLSPEPFKAAHFATFPTEIPRRCILAASRPGDTVLDPFGGSGTTGLVADQLGRNAVLIELNPEYAELARTRISGDAPMLADVEVEARAHLAEHAPRQLDLMGGAA